MANGLYGLLTIGVVASYFRQLTPLGLAYFASELTVMGILIHFERSVLIGDRRRAARTHL